MDVVDQAQRLAEQDLERALNKNKANFVGQDVDFNHCLECGIEIPKARRDAIHSCKHCVDCQELLERQAKHYRKP
ncbi:MULTISPECIES: TraR/DksA C4-type zinc finger protein [Pseudoalteromonas]|uniref:Conjugal transfer protein TraR n=1 Tax=Pseudoalteromonas piscicida TaxID=43662 RepID=A0AAD0RFG4_PSEO7|nr:MULTISPECIES: TraR/DksA C4-type zinc finger protein [Pseudoalteromonas]ASD67706.1 conjugal transfer protein TraR [Pseudoalteromonas piscicida]AXR01590.1 conjugal transfer protein TraR [Pseudoalteromonas piscicida]MCG9761641.1 TraR/DksA C4-type zinc finger protein [Pseudoalteromonas sp. Isolate6]NSY36563.1 conjugal transfer protein TraR [Pseudoalteromonas sp. JC28]NSY36592.1 conjugal transfer protein TraR [Pseudoalteromonas sp. JC28]